MKISKYFITFIMFGIFFFMSIICNGVYILEENIHEDTFQIQDKRGVNASELDDYAKKHDLVLYAREEEQVTLRDYQITYYTDDSHFDNVKEYTGLQEGTVDNITEMRLKIEYRTLEDIPNANAIGRWTLIGESEDKSAFTKEIKSLDFYSIEFEKARQDITGVIPHALMLCAVIILVFYSYIDALFQKKETAISALHGHSVWKFYFINILADSMVFIGIYLIMHFIRQKITMMSAIYSKMHFLLIPLIVSLFLCYLPLVRMRTKDIIRGYGYSDKLLTLISVMKNLSSFVFSLALLLCISMVPSIQKYKKAESFFQMNPDYNFFLFRYDYDTQEVYRSGSYEAVYDQERRQKAEKVEFCEKTDKIFQPVCIADLSGNATEDPSYFDGIYCNYRALPYLRTVIPELENTNIKNYDCILLIPDDLSDTEAKKCTDYLVERFENYEGYTPGTDSALIIRYHPSTPVLCFDYFNDYKLIYYDSPAVCIASDTYSKSNYKELTINHDLLFHGMIYKSDSEKQIKEIFRDYTFSPIVSDCYEKFQYDSQLQRTLFCLSVILTCMMAAFYISVMFVLLQIDYKINEKKLALKTTFGYSVFDKHRHHFIALCIMTVLNILTAVIISRLTGIFSLTVAFVAPSVLCIAEFSISCVMIHHFKKQSIVNILKGAIV